MTPDQKPMTEAEFAELQDAMDEQREELLEALAEDLGGDPEDYRGGDRSVPDGNS